VCGRVAAILNRAHNEYYGENRGFFGFFECVDDQKVADALLGAVRDWFAVQDIHLLQGPVDPGLEYTAGLLVDGFDSPPTFLTRHNPPYYPRLIEGCGYRKCQDLLAYWGHASMLPAITTKLGPIVEQIIRRYDICLRPLSRRHFLRDVKAFLSVYNRSMVDHWGFVPMAAREIEYLACQMRHLIVPELAVGAEIDGRLAGVVVALPDYNPRIRQMDGQLFPFGFARLLHKRHAIKKLRILAANVVPEYQRLGIGLVLLGALVPRALAWGIEEAEFSWVVESNWLSRGSLEKGGAKLVKRYRIYDWVPQGVRVPHLSPAVGRQNPLEEYATPAGV